MSSSSVTIIYGHYITPRIHLSRKLRFWNSACTNRMQRLAWALQINYPHTYIVSSGITFKSHGGKQLIEHREGVPVVTLAQVSFRGIGFLISFLVAFFAALGFRKRRHIRAVIQYNYYPDALLFSLGCKLFHRSRIILDLEDICMPTLADWKRESKKNAFQQVYGYMFLKLSIFLADTVLIPSKKFIPFVKPKRPLLYVAGCQRIRSLVCDMSKHCDSRIRILYAGELSEEHGIRLFMDALRLLENDQSNPDIEVHICGTGKDATWCQQEARRFSKIHVIFHGFLQENEFRALYAKMDICCVLQNPAGRHQHFKTPSKGYEALCNGKPIIVSDIGDFYELPETIYYPLVPYCSERLANILAHLNKKEVIQKSQSALMYAQAYWDVRVVGQILKESEKIPI